MQYLDVICTLLLIGVGYLQKDCEYVWMGFVDLVKKNHSFWTLGQPFGQLTAIIMTDITYAKTKNGKVFFTFSEYFVKPLLAIYLPGGDPMSFATSCFS